MNVLYQSERLNQFKINDLQQQALHAEKLRMARGAEPAAGSLMLRIGRMLRGMAHLSPPRIRIATPVTMTPARPDNAVCLPGMEC